MANKNTSAPAPATAPAPSPAPAAAPVQGNGGDQSEQASQQAAATGEGTQAPEGELLGQATITPASISGLTGASGTQTKADAPVGGDAPASGRAPLPQTGPDAADKSPVGGRAEELIEALRGNSEVYNAFAEIGQYLKDMAPGRNVDEDTGAGHQSRLYSSIQTIIERSGDAFPKAWAALLVLFHENEKGALGVKAFRFMNVITLKPNDRQAYTRLLNLIQHTADPKGREEAVKLTDFPRTLEYGVSQDGRNRILSFYKK